MAITALEARVKISLPEQSIGPLGLSLTAIAPGRYEWVTNGFVRPGAWQLTLNDFGQLTFDIALPIGR